MLSLVVILCIIGIIFAVWKVMKSNRNSVKWCALVIFLAIIAGLLIASEIGMGHCIQDYNNGYYQSQINALMQENEQIAKWKEIVREYSEDDSKFLNELLDRKMKENGKIISEYTTIQENIHYFRWCLYFG